METFPAGSRPREADRAALQGSPEWASAQQAESQTLSDRGNAYNRQGEARRAVGSHEEALAIARRIRESTPEGSPEWIAARQHEAAILGSLGLAYTGLGEARRAISLYKQALAIAHEIRDALPQDSPAWRAAQQEAGATLGNLGLIYAELGDVRRAIGTYEQCLAILREIRNAAAPDSREWRVARSAEGHALANLGNAHAALGDPQRAASAQEQALAIHRQLGERREEGAVLLALGNAYAAQGEARRAIGAYEQGLAIAREVRETAPEGSPEWAEARRAEGDTLGSLGTAYKSRGEVRRAIECIEQSLTICREQGDRRAEGACLSHLGLTHVEMGEPRRAIHAHEQALAIHRDLGDWRRAAADLANLGLAWAEIGEPRRAIDAFEQCLVIYQRHGDRRAEGNALCGLGMALTAAGEPQRAVGYCEESLAIHRELADWRGEGNTLASLGLAYAALGETERAIGAQQQALAIARQMGDRQAEAADLGNLGIAHGVLGDARRAIGHLEKSLVLHREIREAARKDSSEWRAARRGEGNDLGNLGNACAALGETRRAIENYEQQLAIAREVGDRRAEADVSYNLALLLLQQRRRREALAHAERAVRLLAEIDDPQRGERAQQLLAQIQALAPSQVGGSQAG